MCAICRIDFKETPALASVRLTDKGLDSLKMYSVWKKDTELQELLSRKPDVVIVHRDCRKKYTNKQNIMGSLTTVAQSLNKKAHITKTNFIEKRVTQSKVKSLVVLSSLVMSALPFQMISLLPLSQGLPVFTTNDSSSKTADLTSTAPIINDELLLQDLKNPPQCKPGQGTRNGNMACEPCEQGKFRSGSCDLTDPNVDCDCKWRKTCESDQEPTVGDATKDNECKKDSFPPGTRILKVTYLILNSVCRRNPKMQTEKVSTNSHEDEHRKNGMNQSALMCRIPNSLSIVLLAVVSLVLTELMA